jgi:integration host factor subunit beta
MVRSELIETIALKTSINRAKAQEVVTMVFEEIVAALTTEGRVEIRGFGSIAVRKYRAYDGLNPKTGPGKDS